MASNSADAESGYPSEGANWSEEHWHHLLQTLIAQGIVSWREITATILGSMNPSQVGTSIASKESFQSHFERRKCWAAVRGWHFLQSGRCVDCGTRLDLQADHAVPRQFLGTVGLQTLKAFPKLEAVDSAQVVAHIEAELRKLMETHAYSGIQDALVAVLSTDLYGALKSGVSKRAELANVADRLDNMVLRCRRHNVIRRPSHAKGGVTFLTAESGLMWLLFVHRPKSYDDFMKLCREYGLTMANIRFEEAWAMARWLQQVGLYEIATTSKYAPEAQH
jgi:hypothetical protein